MNSLLDTRLNDTRLSTSEEFLAIIPKNRFRVDVWQIFDRFETFAIKLYSATIASLLKNEYLNIANEKHSSITFWKFKIVTDTNYIIQLTDKPRDRLALGWLEEKIFDQFQESKISDLSTIVYGVLCDILYANHSYANPYRVFVTMIAKHQKMDFCEFAEDEELFSKYTIIKHNRGISIQSRDELLDSKRWGLKETEIKIIIKSIKRYFCKFHDLD